jgi:hypothetical protein
LGEVYIEAGYKLGERHWVQPDVSLVSVKQDQSSDAQGYFEAAPQVAIEVISESNTAEYVALPSDDGLSSLGAPGLKNLELRSQPARDATPQILSAKDRRHELHSTRAAAFQGSWGEVQGAQHREAGGRFRELT